MTATGFTASAADQLLSQAEAVRTNVTDRADEIRATIANMTVEGLQGTAADASNELSNDIQITLTKVDEILNRFEQELVAYGETMNQSDATSASRIFG